MVEAEASKVLVTGGTGFLGKTLVRKLVEAGRTVRVLARAPERLEGLPAGIEPALGDLGDHASLAAAVQGVDEVIHAAALVKRWVRDRSQFERINVEGTKAILTAAHGAGARRILYVSSFFALGCSDAGSDGIGDESLPRDADHMHTDYERTKYLAGLEVKKLVQQGAPIVSVYPCVIYGPGELTEANIVVGMLRDHLRGKLPGIPGSGELKWTYAYVQDVVEGILLALDAGKVGEKYILGGETATANRFFEVFQEISGKRPPRLRLPFPLLKAVAVFEGLKARCFGIDPKLTRQEVETYRHNWAFDCAKARRDLGYEPRSLKEGLESTYRWLIEQEPELGRER